MIPQILLHRLVAHHHPESSTRIHIDGCLQIQVFDAKHVFDEAIPCPEVNLAVLEPVIGHVIGRAVFQIKLDQVERLSLIAVGRTRVGGRGVLSPRVVVRLIDSETIPIGKGRPGVAVESPAPIIRTPVRPPSVIEPMPKPVKARSKEHAMVTDVRRVRLHA